MELQGMIDRIKTSKAPEALGTYSQGSKVNQLVFTSGQIGIDPDTGVLITENLKFFLPKRQISLCKLFLELFFLSLAADICSENLFAGGFLNVMPTYALLLIKFSMM